ncbi:DNA methyltransferase, partial [Corynebacterium otitidis]
MAGFDSIINVDELLPDFYFTSTDSKGDSLTKRVRNRIKDFADDEKTPGILTSWGRFKTARATIQQILLDQPSQATSLILEALGYRTPKRVTFETAQGQLELTASTADGVVALAAEPVADISELETTARPAEPVTRDDTWLAGPPPRSTDDAKATDIGEENDDLAGADTAETVNAGNAPEAIAASTPRGGGLSVFKLLTEIFLADEPPVFILVAAGGWLVVAERDSWPLGKYLAINLAAVAERADTTQAGETAHAVCLTCRENLSHLPERDSWLQDTLAESRKAAAAVSDDLREAIRQSVELIGQDVAAHHREAGITLTPDDGELIGRQALRYLYRIMFVLFAEESPELEILPAGVPEYEAGYGTARLKELILSPPVGLQASLGRHVYDSLQVIFRLISTGHNPDKPARDDTWVPDDAAGDPGLVFRGLEADLFSNEATSLIDRFGLNNDTLISVLRLLLLTPERPGRQRGFVSYASLGVAQLGQVYEGLMSFHGTIANRQLVEVAPGGDRAKGSWVVEDTSDIAGQLPDDSVVVRRIDHGRAGVESIPVRYQPGDFVFQASGRDRARSASFYTPQVLTSFTVGQAIAELESSGRIQQADDVLDLRVLEPALGSGAFAVEAVDQLAHLYLKKKQDELGERIPPAEFQLQLQRVKAWIALHRVYGVDLNSTAVELAEISLWLATMTGELTAPWFGLHLRRGNTLIGARRSAYRTSSLKKKAWLKTQPDPVAFPHSQSDGADDETTGLAGRVWSFLLPTTTWGAGVDSATVKKLAADQVKNVKAWRRSVQKSPDSSQVKRLVALSRRVEVLWASSAERMRIANQHAKRDIPVWGQTDVTNPGAVDKTVVTRSEIEDWLSGDENNAYRRLRLVMDAWSALTFWPLTTAETVVDGEQVAPPEWDEWLTTLEELLGQDPLKRTGGTSGQLELGEADGWFELADAEQQFLSFGGARRVDQVASRHPWLAVARRIADRQGFFHWELDYSDVFATSGGFDLIAGNPPWVRPRSDDEMVIGEFDPWFQLTGKHTAKEKTARRNQDLEDPRIATAVIEDAAVTAATAAVLGNQAFYPQLAGQQPDLYRGFMPTTWRLTAPGGVVGLIHPESHFTEKKAAPLRRQAYLRLRRHWQFLNKLILFEIDDHVTFGVHVYAGRQEAPDFIQAVSLYHPDTAVDSLRHDGTGPVPGLKTEDDKWDMRPHADRIQHVTTDTLQLWAGLMETPETPAGEARMVYTVNTDAARVLHTLAAAPRVAELGLQYSSGWHETSDKNAGWFDRGYAQPTSWDGVILQGPHLGVATPMIKQPNPSLKHNQDYTAVDLEAMAAGFLPATGYQP